MSRESLASFYSDAGDGVHGKIPVSGEIQFALEYNYKLGQFEVHVKSCRDLAPADSKKKRSDPYVKTYLLPDKSKTGKRKTKVKKHSLSPCFDETLKYQLTKSELETRTLWLTVWSYGNFGRNDFLGEVTIPLDYYHFTDTTPRWHKLLERNPAVSTLAYKGDLEVALKYISPENIPKDKSKKSKESRGELQVMIKGARNLTAVRANGFSDSFCKGYLLPEKSSRVKKKTPVIKKNVNPLWNHNFIFENLPWEDLKDRCLELTVWDHDRLTSNDFLGGVRLSLGTGNSADKEVDWMDSTGKEISIWQRMLDSPNYWIEDTLSLRPSMSGKHHKPR
ncbi:hypothetical protein CAPTEDRAFT_184235 [Capitella teleta]|uniref:C2 domain-containing protein n=1 Tax=Capitella teleta TaxID=283909 RepID=X1ZGX1_CAPTE|nr:hypothetical protein CAPTEDRAFT_184235 [Capitella teleta]|eukprot:ELU00294.1 hypothetical protein CAPTEDRAFT_184235 [Capitella teleta]